MGGPPPTATPRGTPSLGRLVAVGSLAVVLIVIGALYGLGAGPFERPATTRPPTGTSGAFTQGQAVTLEYADYSVCAPTLAQLYPDASALNATTPCEFGDADLRTDPSATPQWLLVPAFAGLSAFGDMDAGATSQGFPTVAGSTLLTDCPAGGGSLSCPQVPPAVYSPTFTALERFANISDGVNGLPEGLLPTPAHDILINTSATVSSPTAWGTIVVLVFDPNIFPDRSNGACATTVPSNLTIPTGNCLTSLAALDRALLTASASVEAANGAPANNPVWKSLGGPIDQVYAANDPTVTDGDHDLNSDLYETYGVSSALPSFPAP
jgi:hypothetical protein